MAIEPFADDAATTGIGDMTVENGTDVIVVSGSLEIGRDKAGLKHALALKEVIDAIVKTLQSSNDLPDKIQVSDAPTATVPNPFR